MPITSTSTIGGLGGGCARSLRLRGRLCWCSAGTITNAGRGLVICGGGGIIRYTLSVIVTGTIGGGSAVIAIVVNTLGGGGFIVTGLAIVAAPNVTAMTSLNRSAYAHSRRQRIDHLVHAIANGSGGFIQSIAQRCASLRREIPHHTDDFTGHCSPITAHRVLHTLGYSGLRNRQRRAQRVHQAERLSPFFLCLLIERGGFVIPVEHPRGAGFTGELRGGFTVCNDGRGDGSGGCLNLWARAIPHGFQLLVRELGVHEHRQVRAHQHLVLGGSDVRLADPRVACLMGGDE